MFHRPRIFSVCWKKCITIISIFEYRILVNRFVKCEPHVHHLYWEEYESYDSQSVRKGFFLFTDQCKAPFVSFAVFNIRDAVRCLRREIYGHVTEMKRVWAWLSLLRPSSLTIFTKYLLAISEELTAYVNEVHESRLLKSQCNFIRLWQTILINLSPSLPKTKCESF